MLWPAVLPAAITLAILLGLIAVGTAAVPSRGTPRVVTAIALAILGAVAFIPSCAGIMAVVDSFRFGEFSYADYGSVDDERVYRYLPPDASDITLHKAAGGYRARFRIARPALDRWFDSVWKEFSSLSATGREKPRTVDQDSIKLHFESLAWPLPKKAIEYSGPRADNGAGFTLWYDESTGMAYQDAGYW